MKMLLTYSKSALKSDLRGVLKTRNFLSPFKSVFVWSFIIQNLGRFEFWSLKIKCSTFKELHFLFRPFCLKVDGLKVTRP